MEKILFYVSGVNLRITVSSPVYADLVFLPFNSKCVPKIRWMEKSLVWRVDDERKSCIFAFRCLNVDVLHVLPALWQPWGDVVFLFHFSFPSLLWLDWSAQNHDHNPNWNTDCEARRYRPIWPTSPMLLWLIRRKVFKIWWRFSPNPFLSL